MHVKRLKKKSKKHYYDFSYLTTNTILSDKRLGPENIGKRNI